MVMETVDAALTRQFSGMMHVVAQQTQARLRKCVTIKRMTADDFAYDGVGTLEARELTARFNQTQFDDLPFTRRKIGKRRFTATIPMDKHDVEGMMTDPQGQIAQAAVNAMERVFDRVCYDAMFADVATGREFGTSVTFANDGGLTVNATAGLTLAKILEVTRNFCDNEVGNEVEVSKWVGISGDEQQTLLQIEEFTSAFYSRGMQLEGGKIKNAAGLDFIMFGASVSNPLLAVSGGTRTSFALATNGLCVGLARDWEINIDRRVDYVDTVQVQIVGTLGAVRTEGKLIQKLTTTDQ